MRRLATLLLLLLGLSSVTLAQDLPSLPDLPPPPTFSPQDLEQLVAPIALYPDDLLIQVLMASVYPAEVAEASRWVRAHPNMDRGQRDEALGQMPWDPSVTSLTEVPEALFLLDKDLHWTQSLGIAFTHQQKELLGAVQAMRGRAMEANTVPVPPGEGASPPPTVPTAPILSGPLLGSTSEGQIVITSSNPDLVYIPYYSPLTVYGVGWRPGYLLYPAVMTPPPGWQQASVISYSQPIPTHGSMFGGVVWTQKTVFLKPNYFTASIYQGGVQSNQVYSGQGTQVWRPNLVRESRARLITAPPLQNTTLRPAPPPQRRPAPKKHATPSPK